MKTKLHLFALVAILSLSGASIKAQMVYATLSSGNWDLSATWETYSSYASALSMTPGSGTAATTIPSGTHNVLIRTGHTISMNGANRGCKGIIIQSGGKLWANEATSRRLQIGNGGTGFTYPLIDTVKVDGILGGPSDGVFIEVGKESQNTKIFGSGSIDILRIRCSGGNSGQVMTLDIDANINFWINTNYALSLVYNPAATDDYTLNIKPGRTVSVKSPDGSFHNSQNTTTYGKYTYNIQGTLDLTANIQTASALSANIIAPTGTSSKITLNIDGGTLKTGAGFKCDTSTAGPVSTGILDINVINGGVLDATLATNFRLGKTSNAAGGYAELFAGLDGTGSVKQLVGSADVKFPVGINTGTTESACRIANSGVADVHTVKIKSTFDQTPTVQNKVVNRQWTITEGTNGGSVDTIRLSWVTADQSPAFNPASSVSIMRWTGSAWDYPTTTVSGSGTDDDPYVAKAVVTSLGIFGVTNFAPVPLKLLSFSGMLKSGSVSLQWSTANEVNLDRFVVEESVDGKAFHTVGNVEASQGLTSQRYSYEKPGQLIGSAYYRLKAVDRDGQFQYSEVVKLTNNKVASMTILNNVVSNNQLRLQFSGFNKGNYILCVRNMVGQLLQKNNVQLSGNSIVYPVNLNTSMQSGLYQIELLGNSRIQTQQFMVP